MPRSKLELTTVRLNRDTRKKIKQWAKDHQVSEGVVIRQMLALAERHFMQEAFQRRRSDDRQLSLPFTDPNPVDPQDSRVKVAGHSTKVSHKFARRD